VPPIEGAAPGLTALFNGISENRNHAVLDLGSASDQSLRVYSRFARWIYFADLLGAQPSSQAQAAGLQLPKLEEPYDLVCAWDILDHLVLPDRLQLVEWLVENTTATARVHVVVRASDDAVPHPLRFTVVDVGQIRYEEAGDGQLPRSRLLPAEVGKVLAPFRVLHAFTLRNGLREYLAAR
jgi:hypothetical protein